MSLKLIASFLPQDAQQLVSIYLGFLAHSPVEAHDRQFLFESRQFALFLTTTSRVSVTQRVTGGCLVFTGLLPHL